MKTETLQVTTPTECEILMKRVFDAPRALVFRAMTEPALVRRWLLGPPGWEMVVCELDYRVGGRFRYTWKHEDGRTFGIGGIYREIVPPEKSVHVETMEGQPGEAVVTGTLTESGRKTTLTTQVVFPSREVRDGALKSGMLRGVTASYDRLADVLASMP